MILRVLIVDDEPAAGLYLKTIIEEVPGVDVAAIAMSGQEALQKAAIYLPQIVFLDIDMPDMNGLEVARTLVNSQEDIFLVFATAYPDYALQAFELYSFDYILKPFNEKRIKRTLSKLIEKIQHKSTRKSVFDNCIAVETQTGKIWLKPGEIQYVESRKPSTIIKTLTETYITKGGMDTFEKILQPYNFCRCHRSYLINPKLIKEIVRSGRTFQIALTSGERVLLSRRQEKTLRDILQYRV
jgi:two-component system, LytTR family, response regulator LytT